MADSEIREAFALFDRKGKGTIASENLGDLLRALGQNPTQAEVAELAAAAPREIDYATFTKILNRPDGFKPAGTPEEFIRGFQVFDKDGTGYIGVGELRYVLTSLGEKLTNEEVDELLKGVSVGEYVTLLTAATATSTTRPLCARSFRSRRFSARSEHSRSHTLASRSE